MKIKFLSLFFFLSLALFAQDDEINLEDEIIDTNSLQDLSGYLVLDGKGLYYVADNCLYKDKKFSLEGYENKKFKTKKWVKQAKKSKGVIHNVLIKGLMNLEASSIAVQKISKPLKMPKKWSGGASAIYLDAATALYQKTIELRNDFKIFSVAVEEVEDPTLGTITEYSIFNKKCEKLTPEQIKNISEKELNDLNNAIEVGGGLVLKQAALAKLAALSVEEVSQAGGLAKIPIGKDAATAGVFQTAIVAQLPKILRNLKASKQYIKQLQSE